MRYMDKERGDIDAALVRMMFNYDPETGLFTRLTSPAPNAPAGAVAGRRNTFGYVQICINGRRYVAHRLAWLYMTGAWPDEEIDHINRDPSDNRWRNLRAATRGQNRVNAGHRRKHDLPRGVSRVGNRYQAQIRKHGKFCHIGMFGTPEDAHRAWLAAAMARDPDFIPQELRV